MDALKSIFSWLGKFLEKTRVVLLNVATALILIVITVAILGGIFSGDAEIDREGKVVFLDPAVVITDEEAFADSLFANTDINQMTFRDFEEADEVFMTGNMTKIMPVTAFEDKNYQVGSIAKLARELYWDWSRSQTL